MSCYYSEKYIVNRKAELNLERQTNSNKAGPLPRVLKTMLRGTRMGNLPGDIFLLGGGNLTRSSLGTQTFFKAKNNIFEHIEH